MMLPTATSQAVKHEGAQLGGAIVASIDNFGIAEDGESVLVLATLQDGRIASISLSPGEPITIAIVAGTERAEPGPH